jgi:hypothetical protein
LYWLLMIHCTVLMIDGILWAATVVLMMMIWYLLHCSLLLGRWWWWYSDGDDDTWWPLLESDWLVPMPGIYWWRVFLLMTICIDDDVAVLYSPYYCRGKLRCLVR